MIEIVQGHSTMVLNLQIGETEEGTPLFKDKSYSMVLPNANEDDLFAVGEALASLSAWKLHHIQRIDRENIVKTA
jgi:predicted aconitase